MDMYCWITRAKCRICDETISSGLDTQRKTASIPNFEISVTFSVRPIGKRKSDVSYWQAGNGLQGPCKWMVLPSPPHSPRPARTLIPPAAHWRPPPLQRGRHPPLEACACEPTAGPPPAGAPGTAELLPPQSLLFSRPLIEGRKMGSCIYMQKQQAHCFLEYLSLKTSACF